MTKTPGNTFVMWSSYGSSRTVRKCTACERFCRAKRIAVSHHIRGVHAHSGTGTCSSHAAIQWSDSGDRA